MILKNNWAILLLFCINTATFAGENPFDIARINPLLLIKVHSVVRHDNTVLKIQSIDKVVETCQKAITVLNKKGDDYAQIYIHTNKMKNVSSFKATIYDEKGKVVKTFHKNDLIDMANSTSSLTLIDDDRVKILAYESGTYPYTIDYEYETVSKSSMFYTIWLPQRDVSGISVEKASLTINTKMDNAYRVKTVNLPEGIVHTKNEEGETWACSNLMTKHHEPFTSNFQEVARIYIAPNDFVYDGHKGNMSSWKSFGAWNTELWRDRDKVPPAIKADIEALKVAAKDDKKRLISDIYAYMQKHTRYVSVQLGIGGFQPITAENVQKTGYGDCKALTNYMRTLLHIVDIPSIPTLVYAGDEDQEYSISFPDFPSVGQANHVILCVPLAADTVWLECTSQRLAAGFLGDFTDNRQVLLLTEQGGVITKTPAYTQNKCTNNVALTVDAGGSCSAKLQSIYEGIAYSDKVNELDNTKKEQQESFSERVAGAIELKDYKLTYDPVQPISLQEQTEWTCSKYAALTGKRLFLPLAPLKFDFNVPEPLQKRTKPFIFYHDKEYVNQITFTIPEGYTVEALPKNITESHDFADFSVNYTQKGQQIVVNSVLKQKKGTFSPDAYSNLISFSKLVQTSETQKAVLVLQKN